MRGFRSLVLALLLPVATPAAGSHLWDPLPQREREALIDLYNETNGDEWSIREGWLGPPGTECDWFGVECACFSEFGGPCPFVYGIDLQHNNLRGRLPRSISNLRSLRLLDMLVNRLRGELPHELGRLRNLKLLELGVNELTGEIPPELGNLTRLRWLNLSGNKLRGTIPSEMANLKRLQGLGLIQNQLTGDIPRWLGSLTELVDLGLGRNQLTGQIPEELFDLEHLTALGLEENHLTGRIPEGIGNHDLHGVTLQGNRLTGPIPESILNLDFLSFINVDWNAVYPTSAEVEQFLIDRSGHLGWVLTQTLPPEDLTATTTGPTSVRLEWVPVNYIPGVLHEQGGYLVYARAASDSRFRLVKTVPGKQTSAVDVAGLTPGTTYTFRIRTSSRPHAENENTVRSEMTQPVTATTLPAQRGGGHP